MNPAPAPRMRARPEDFVVDEIPLYPPSGTGAHTFVRVEKRGRTTEEVARALARAAGVPPSEVGYAGRKDRHAVTRQWFSVPGLDVERALGLALVDARVLEAARHPHKLRTGHLRANAFDLRLRGVEAEAAARARARLAGVVERGLSNRFGAQRYGASGDNVERGRAVLTGRLRLRDRRAARFLVSALQAAIFDEALARRTQPLDAVEAGDVAEVVATGGQFRVEQPEVEGLRAAAFEISATGPILGGRTLEPFGEPAARERAAGADFGIEPDLVRRPPPGLRIRGARRPVRVAVREVELEHSGDVLRLRFVLPPGSYATVFVEEVVGSVADVGGADDGAGGAGLPSGRSSIPRCEEAP
jgi:tRNA pseudouridine13 synthase